MKQNLSEAKNPQLKSLLVIDEALTTARAEAEKVDHVFLRYLLRLAHEETTEILEDTQDANWNKPV